MLRPYSTTRDTKHRDKSAAVALAIVLQLLTQGMLGSSATAAPQLITAWGSLGSGPGQFRYPHGIAVGHDGAVYVSDSGNSRVQKFASDGTFVQLWSAVCEDVTVGADGNVYTIATDGTVTGFSPGGSQLSQWVALSNQGSFYSIAGLPNGDLVLGQLNADWDTGSACIYSTSGARIRSWTVCSLGSEGASVGPIGVAADLSGNVYTVNSADDSVRIYTSNGLAIASFGGPGNSPGQLAGPMGMAASTAGNLVIADRLNNRLQVFAESGVVLDCWGQYGSAPEQFANPWDVAISPDGRIYVADESNNRIEVYGEMPTGVANATWGQVKATYRR